MNLVLLGTRVYFRDIPECPKVAQRQLVGWFDVTPIMVLIVYAARGTLEAKKGTQGGTQLLYQRNPISVFRHFESQV